MICPYVRICSTSLAAYFADTPFFCAWKGVLMASKEVVEKGRQTGSRGLERTAGEGREQNRKDHTPDVRQSALALDAGGSRHAGSSWKNTRERIP